MKRKLFKFALLCASVFMLPMGAWADEYSVSTTKTWTFDGLTTNTKYKEVTSPTSEYYLRGSSSPNRYLTVTEGSSITKSFSDGYFFTTSKYLAVNAGFSNSGTSGTELTSTSTAGQTTTETKGSDSHQELIASGCFAVNVSVPGTLYAYMSSATPSTNLRIYFTDDIGHPKANTSGAADEVVEVSATISNASGGTFFVGNPSTECKIHAVRFVPTSEKKDEWVYIGSTGYATWGNSSGKDINELPSGLTAYKATAGAAGSETITLTSLDQMRRGQGYVLKGTANTNYPLTYGGTSLPEEYNGGDMIRVSSDMANFAATIIGDDSKTRYRYILGNDNGTAKFFVPSGSGTLKKGKAYLQTLRNLIPASGSARGIRIVFADDITGVNEVKTQSEKVDNKYYDMMGRRVMNPTKGLYILNGKKVIIK